MYDEIELNNKFCCNLIVIRGKKEFKGILMMFLKVLTIRYIKLWLLNILNFVRLENFEQNLDPDFSVSDFEDDLEDGLRASASSTSTTLISQQALTAPNPKMSVTAKSRPSADMTTIATRFSIQLNRQLRISLKVKF